MASDLFENNTRRSSTGIGQALVKGFKFKKWVFESDFLHYIAYHTN